MLVPVQGIELATYLINKHIMKPTQFCKESLLSCLLIILEDSISEEKNLFSRMDNKQQTKLSAKRIDDLRHFLVVQKTANKIHCE